MQKSHLHVENDVYFCLYICSIVSEFDFVQYFIIKVKKLIFVKTMHVSVGCGFFVCLLVVFFFLELGNQSRREKPCSVQEVYGMI